MERLEKQKTLAFIMLCLVFILCGCKKECEIDLSFRPIFEAYRRHLDKTTDWDSLRAMRAESFIDSIAQGKAMKGRQREIDHMGRSLLFDYVACCNGAVVKDCEFVPTSDNHSGIAFFNEIVTSDGVWWTGDIMKVYFPDTAKAMSFFNEAIGFGFVRDESYLEEEEEKEKTRFSYFASYWDDENKALYSVRIYSEKDPNVVILYYRQ